MRNHLTTAHHCNIGYADRYTAAIFACFATAVYLSVWLLILHV